MQHNIVDRQDLVRRNGAIVCTDREKIKAARLIKQKKKEERESLLELYERINSLEQRVKELENGHTNS